MMRTTAFGGKNQKRGAGAVLGYGFHHKGQGGGVGLGTAMGFGKGQGIKLFPGKYLVGFGRKPAGGLYCLQPDAPGDSGRFLGCGF